MKTRILAILAAAAVVLSLAACTEPGGPDTEKWLKSQSVVSSVHLKYDTDGLAELPDLTATVKPTASDAALKSLAAKASLYLGEHSNERIYLALKIGTDSLTVEQGQASAIADEWVAVHHDSRVQIGSIDEVSLLYTARPEVVPVYRDYAAYGAVTVSENIRTEDAAQIGGATPCSPTPAAVSFAAAVIANPAVKGTNLDPCGTSLIAVGDPSAMSAVAASTRSTAPANTRVVFDADPSSEFDLPAYSIALSAATSPRLSLFDTAIHVSGVTSAVLGDDASLKVEGPLHAVAHYLFSSPARSSAKSIFLTSGRITVGARDQDGFAQNYALAKRLEAIGSSTYVLVSPDEITVTLLTYPGKKIDDYTKYGKAELAAIAASSLWKTRTVTVKPDNDSGVVFTKGAASAPNDDLPANAAYVAYWKSLIH